jgi:hypothetical protein
MARNPYRMVFVAVCGVGGAWALTHWTNRIADAHPDYSILINLGFLALIFLVGWLLTPMDRRMLERERESELERDFQSHPEYSPSSDLDQPKLTIEHEPTRPVRSRLK